MNLHQQFIGGQKVERVVHGLGIWTINNPWIGSRDTGADDGFGELIFVPVAGAIHYLTQGEH